MFTWAIAGALCAVGLVVTLVALFADDRTRRRGPEQPEWVLPAPVDVRQARFPLVWQGYDPTHVDLYLEALVNAYEELYVEAGPEVVARAREQLALRLGRSEESVPEPSEGS